MNILFLIPSLQIGGSERQLALLAGRLKQQGHEVTVIVSYLTGTGLESGLRERGVQVRTIGRKRRGVLSMPLEALSLARIVRRLKPDILYSYLDSANLCSALAKPFLGSTRTVWGIRNAYVDYARYGPASRIAHRLTFPFSKIPDLILFNSSSGLSLRVKGGYPARKSRVVHNGIETDAFFPDPAAGAAMRESLGLLSASPLIGMVGRLDPMKDYPVFLEAASIFVSRPGSGNARFICVGDGPAAYKAQLRQYAGKLGIGSRVIWLEAAKDLRAAYNCLDLFTLSSYGEGFSNVIAEAMACGKACAVTDVGDSSEIVGDTGIAVPPKDPQALARAWRELIAKGADAMGKRARERVEERFSVERMTRETVDHFKAILG